MSHDLVSFNGVRPDGSYLQPPISEEELARRLLAEPPDWSLPQVEDDRDINDPTRRPIYGVEPSKLEEAGWGVIFPAGVDGRIKRALRDLLDRRAEQAGEEREERYRELVYYSGETAEDFLKRHRAPAGVADPDRLPYHLLIVGDPREIPFELQFELDFAYSVGRLHFERFGDYEIYARSVVASEKRRMRRTPEITFFGVKNPGDNATRRTTEELLHPLTAKLVERQVTKSAGWTMHQIFGEEATKARLLRLLGGEETPSVLFTASHGMAFERGNERQVAQQGALLCTDWPGPDSEAKPDYYVAAEDISDEAQLQGLIAFHFACYGAGTQAQDSFRNKKGAYDRLAPHPFVARLPQRLLSHPNGGALAVISHVDRAWTTSFSWRETGQPEVFDSLIRCLLDGKTVGEAMDFFDQLQGDLGTKLNDQWEKKESLSPTESHRFARRRLASRDARNFVVLGDPAVRVGGMGG